MMESALVPHHIYTRGMTRNWWQYLRFCATDVGRTLQGALEEPRMTVAAVGRHARPVYHRIWYLVRKLLWNLVAIL